MNESLAVGIPSQMLIRLYFLCFISLKDLLPLHWLNVPQPQNPITVTVIMWMILNTSLRTLHGEFDYT